ncbi:hypothetical protein AAHA92_21079 [Salvia divinorum]|uniref:Uncharacterized protein n=1 Tax=Salvia divinorum TaxID=28513 RepID=A0ABD1GJ97_SALDI
MGSFSGLVIGLSSVFGCIIMGLVAELYYLLWWKKMLAKTTSSSIEIQESSLLRKPKSCSHELTNHQDLEIGSATNNKELGLKCEEGIEAELMRVHNLFGPPRFLFTIKEESKEDLELSEDGRSSRTTSLSDVVVALDSPFLKPLSSPSPPSDLDSYSHHGINPLFESLPEADLRLSPPSKFKFLRDAEDKLLQEEAQRRIIAQNL